MLKGTVRIVLAAYFVLSLAACASSVSTTPPPTEQIESTSQPADVIPAENTATTATIPKPTATSTPVPPPPSQWYWGRDVNSDKFLVVNQFGEKREIGNLDIPETTQITGFSLDAERVLFFAYDQNTIHAYLLGMDDMKQIELPDGFGSPPDPALAWASLRVVGVYGDFAMLSYITRPGSNIDSEAGPVWLVNLKSFAIKQIDENGNSFSFSDWRLYFHASIDGRYVRYVNGDYRKADIREVDLASGDVRTIYSAADFNISASPQGDLWFLRESKLVFDIDGNQKDFTVDDSFSFRFFEGKSGVIFPRNCDDNCELRIVFPFEDEAELKYTLPWGIQGVYYPLFNQFLPDQSLIFVGEPYSKLQATPAIVKDYPSLKADDEPVFRLSPDGQARIVGIYRNAEFETSGSIPVSSDGRYFLLKSLDGTSFFIYDAVADRPLFSMPSYSDINPYVDVKFLARGIIVQIVGNVTADGADTYFHAYSFDSGKTISWDGGGTQYAYCEDILTDGSLICWTGAEPIHTNLVRYDPATTEVIILQKELGPVK